MSGLRIIREIISKSALKRSAFCDGGRGGGDRRKILERNRKSAKTKRIGRIVKVYRKESKHKMNPKPIILQRAYQAMIVKSKSKCLPFPLPKASVRNCVHVPISALGESQSPWLIVPPVGNPTMRMVDQSEILVAGHLHSFEFEELVE